MNRSIKIEIKESAEELRRLYHCETDKRKAERLQFLYLLKTQKVTSLTEATNLLMYHRHTYASWVNKYEQGGLEELLRREQPGGMRPNVTAELKKLLDEHLEKDGFSSYKEAYAFMQEHGFPSSYDAAMKYLKKYHNTRLKTSRPRHIKQDQEALESFKKTLVKSSRNSAGKTRQKK